MSFLLATVLAVSGPVQSACTWDRPGANPFMGDVVAAVDRYQDIPADVRAKLKQRMAVRRYDELATIKRDSISGAYAYSNLRDMHFGQGTVCRTVTRERWTDQMQERGLVYCEQGHCLIVPTVCRNVSRVTRLQKIQARSEPQPSLPTSLNLPFAAAEPAELQFEAPAAGGGPSFASLAQDSSGAPVTSLGEAQPIAAPRAAPPDTSWLGFAGYRGPIAPMLFLPDAGLPRGMLLSAPVLSSGMPAVPGVVPPPSNPPVPTTELLVPPVVVSLPTVPGLVETPPAPGPVPGPLPGAVLPVPNVPGVSEVPSVPSHPGVPLVPPAPRLPPSPGSPPGSFDGAGGLGDPVVSASPIPEPATLALMALGLVLVRWMSRRPIRRSAEIG
jgi:PEP-CTERM motif